MFSFNFETVLNVRQSKWTHCCMWIINQLQMLFLPFSIRSWHLQCICVDGKSIFILLSIVWTGDWNLHLTVDFATWLVTLQQDCSQSILKLEVSVGVEVCVVLSRWFYPLIDVLKGWWSRSLQVSSCPRSPHSNRIYLAVILITMDTILHTFWSFASYYDVLKNVSILLIVFCLSINLDLNPLKSFHL